MFIVLLLNEAAESTLPPKFRFHDSNTHTIPEASSHETQVRELSIEEESMVLYHTLIISLLQYIYSTTTPIFVVVMSL